MYPFRDLNFFASVPAGLIHHQKYMLVLACSHLFSKLIESHREQLHIDRGQDQPVDLSALRPHKTVEIGPFVASLEASNGSLSHRCPYAPHHRLQAQPSLIFSPEFDLGSRVCIFDLLQLLGEIFLKASRFSDSAPWAFEGLGT
jgi:hypothetical protein